MSILMSFFVYFLIWWVMLFTVLPFGIKRHEEEGKGYDAGAPEKTNLKKKLILNSIISLVILAVIQILVITGVISFETIFESNWK